MKSEQESQQNQRSTNTTPAPVLVLRTVTYCTENEGTPWRATLTREQHALLCDPVISQTLNELALKHGWIEHFVIGAPFGVLALDGNGSVSWLQLEPADRLVELAEMATLQGWDAATVQDVADGKKLINLELQLALGGTHKPYPRAATALPSGTSPLYMALFPVEESFAPGALLGHDRFMEDQGERSLQD